MTYAKRYTLSAVTGIAPDDDDDGNAASADKAPRAAQRQARPSQQERVDNVIGALARTDSTPALNKVWDDVRASGLDGVPAVLAAYEAQAAKFPADANDAWALELPVEAQR